MKRKPTRQKTRHAHQQLGSRSLPTPVRIALLLICVSGLAIAAWNFWPRGVGSSSAQSQKTNVSVPEISLSDIDPAAAETLRAARKRVVEAPESAEAWGRFGMLLNAYEFSTASADACFAEAARLDPAEPRWVYYRGMVLSTAQPAEAIVLLQRASSMLGNRGSAARLQLSELLLAQDRLDEADQTLKKMLADEPDNSRAVLNLARLALRRQRADEARKLAERAASSPRDRKAAMTVIAQAELVLGDADASRAAAAQAAELPADPAWPDPLLEEIGALRTGHRAQLARADLLLAQDRAPEAIGSLTGTLKAYPKSDWAWLLLGRAHLQGNDFASAEAALLKSVELKPNSVEALYYLGTVHLLRENYNEAAQWYRNALEHKPDFAMAHYNLGHCYWRTNDAKGAIEQFRETIAAKPNYAPVHLDLATLLADDGESAEALSEVKMALRLNPNDRRAKALLQRLEGM